MTGQEGNQLRSNADGPHAGPAAAVGDAEGFVQVEVADIGADVAGPAQADLGVHVRAVHVNLPAVAVDDVADVFDAGFEHAVRAGVGDHDGGEIFLVLFGFFRQVGDVDIAMIVAGDRHHFQPGDDGAGGIGAVGAGGDEADGAVMIAARFVIGADD